MTFTDEKALEGAAEGFTDKAHRFVALRIEIDIRVSEGLDRGLVGIRPVLTVLLSLRSSPVETRHFRSIVMSSKRCHVVDGFRIGQGLFSRAGLVGAGHVFGL